LAGFEGRIAVVPGRLSLLRSWAQAGSRLSGPCPVPDAQRDSPGHLAARQAACHIVAVPHLTPADFRPARTLHCIQRWMPCPPLLPPGYRRRRPESGALHLILREHLETFLERVDEDPCSPGLASFVEAELRGYLRCGILAHGFARCRCATCKDDILVAFSCKGRGICSSCAGRRMAEGAARLVDEVLPRVPVRQWVLTLPYPLRYRLAWDSALLTEVLNVFLSEVTACYARLARARGLSEAKTGAYTVIQRFSGSLALNIHLHSLLLDGVFVPGDAEQAPVFQPLAVKEADVLAVVRSTELAVLRLLERKGLIEPEECLPRGEDEFAEQQPLMAGLYQSSVEGRIAVGERRGLAVRRLRGLPSSRQAARRRPKRKKPMCATSGAFDLHARVRIRAEHRGELERLARYLLRPAIALDRLRLLPGGMVAYDLRAPWADGTTGFLFSPMEFIEKLAALVPPKGRNLVRYHGVLAPGSRLRALVVPGKRRRKEGAPPKLIPRTRIPWADLLKRVFSIEILRCVRCGGWREVMGVVKDPLAARKILEHLGMDTEAYEPLPARAPPQLD
ncbi:MAG TPA: transposase, partial [Myxococcota bacterium]|nr:transposase [Myxococcota bacterium]